MQISLKKALKLRGAIETLLGATELPVKTTLSIFVADNRTKPEQAVQTASALLAEKLQDKLTLSTVLAKLRSTIAQANVQAGIEGLLSEQADLDRRIAIYKTLAAVNATASSEVIVGEMEVAFRNISNAENSRTFGQAERSVQVSTVSEALREEALKKVTELRREREDVEDRRSAANTTHKVEIADDDELFLRKLGVI